MIVCADDFGLAADIDRAIIDLVSRRRLSAVSCMVALERFDRSAFGQLLDHCATLDIGLHLTLTDIAPVQASKPASLVTSSGVLPAMGDLLRRGIRGQLDPGEVAREARAQYDRFTELAGRPPDYVDSHLHVHQFPGVRDGMMRFLSELRPASGFYVRNAAISPVKAFRQGVSPLKCLGIGFFGSGFRKRLIQGGIRTNKGFAGVYAYDGHEAYPGYLKRFSSCMESENGILMTHPGEVEPWRAIEYRTLMTAECLDGRINRFSASA